MTRTCACLTVALLAVACSRGGNTEPSKQRKQMTPTPTATAPKIKAHRGASFSAPENTLASVRLAWADGADGVEVDVHVSSDGHPVVIHDDNTARTGGVNKKVRQQTLAELQTLDVGAWKSPAYRGQRIPTLAAVLDTVPRGGTLFIEIKSPPDTVPAIAAVVRAHDPAVRGGGYAFESFDLPVLAAVKRLLPGARRYWTLGISRDPETRAERPLDIRLARLGAAAGVTGLAVDHRGVTPQFVDAVAEHKLVLGVWTVDDAARAHLMREYGAVWIETNRPALIRDALK